MLTLETLQNPRLNRSERIRKKRGSYDQDLYKQRHKIEIMFGRIKDWIRNGILYIFYKETLQQTIDLKSIRYVYFFLKESSRETKIHPRMKVFNGRTFILCIKLSVDNYLLLKAFFTRNNVKITDNYTIL